MTAYSPYVHGREAEKFALFPVRTTSKKWVWFKKYYIVYRYLNTETVRLERIEKKLTGKEYTVYLLKKPAYALESGKSVKR